MQIIKQLKKRRLDTFFFSRQISSHLGLHESSRDCGRQGEHGGSAVIRQAERKAHIRYTIRTPPSSSSYKTSLIMSKLSCGSKYSPYFVRVWSAKHQILLFTLSSSFIVKEKPSDSKRLTCVPLEINLFPKLIPLPPPAVGEYELVKDEEVSKHPTLFCSPSTAQTLNIQGLLINFLYNFVSLFQHFGVLSWIKWWVLSRRLSHLQGTPLTKWWL